MTNPKTAKRAVILSAIAFVLSFAMLVGATLAWFTDSVTVERNRIEAGNLDIELLHSNSFTGEFAPVESDTKLFVNKNGTDILWEPGAASVETFKIVNKGTVALKYEFTITGYDYNTFNGKSLMDALSIYTVDADKNVESGLLKNTTFNGVLLAGETIEVPVGIYWEPTTTDNDFNLKDEANLGGGEYATSDGYALWIDLGINLVATQATHEEDFEDDQYDADAKFPVIVATTEEMTAALADGAQDIFVVGAVEMTVARAGRNTDLKGVNITGASADASLTMLGTGGGLSNVNLKNITVIDSTFYTSENGENAWEFTYLEFDGNNSFVNVAFDDGIFVEGGNSTFVDCSFSGHNNDSSEHGNTTMYGAWVYSGSASFTGCEFFGTRGLKVADQYSGSDVTDVVVDNCFFGPLSEKPGVAVDNRLGSLNLVIKNSTFAGTQPGDGADDSTKGVPYIYENDNRTPDVTTITLENNTVAGYVNDTATLDEALKAGNTTIYLLAGTYNIPASAKGKTLTINGTEGTIIEVVPAGQGEANGQLDYNLDSSTVTFNNVTIKTNNQTYAGYARLSATYNNCTFENQYCLNRDSEFNDCTLNVSGDVYNIWTWGAPNATFNNCTFNSDGKALLLYGTADTHLTVNNCVFNDNGGLTDLKAAIEIGNDYNKTYTLTVNNTTVNGYEINDKGICTFSTLWANKNSMGTDKLTVTVDGVEVYGSNNTKTVYIDSAAGLFAFANDVNVKGNNYSGKTVALTKDIDLENKAWTPIGQTGATEFKGIFDGQGYTIKNLTIDSSAQTGANYSSGLFGWIESHSNQGVTIMNVNVDGASVTGNHNVAVIAGYLYGKVINCHVTNATVVANHANDDACGDKAGVIVGYAGPAVDKVSITDCSATNSTVTAGRDAGQLIGAGYNAGVSNCTATNVTVSANGQCTGANINEALIGRVMG